MNMDQKFQMIAQLVVAMREAGLDVPSDEDFVVRLRTTNEVVASILFQAGDSLDVLVL